MPTVAKNSGKARVFVPATVGNVGPGFDVLGLAVEGLGDHFTAELTPDKSVIAAVSGRDADQIPRDPEANCAAIAAVALLRRLGHKGGVALSMHRELPVAGGLGSSAAASVGGACAAALAVGAVLTDPDALQAILAAALDGEERVAGRHLDNIAPALFGGVCLVLRTEPADVIKLAVKGDWWVALVSPAARLATKAARGVLPQTVSQKDFVQQMAHTAGLVSAFAQGDHALARRSLFDVYAEPRRAPLIERFVDVKIAALDAGALGCSISGAGPTVFALAATEADAHRIGAAMTSGFSPIAATLHIGRIATQGARAL